MDIPNDACSRSTRTTLLELYNNTCHNFGPLHHRSTILFALGPDHALTVLFLGTHEQLLVGHPSWECYGPFSLNFEVPTEPKASELPKGLVLGRDENIHLRITPLGDVGYYNVVCIQHSIIIRETEIIVLYILLAFNIYNCELSLCVYQFIFMVFSFLNEI